MIACRVGSPVARRDDRGRPGIAPAADHCSVPGMRRARAAAGTTAGANAQARRVDGATYDNRLLTASSSATASSRRKNLNRATGSWPIRWRAATTRASTSSRNSSSSVESSMRRCWRVRGRPSRRISAAFAVNQRPRRGAGASGSGDGVAQLHPIASMMPCASAVSLSARSVVSFLPRCARTSLPKAVNMA